MELLGDLWTEVITRPMINSLVMLYFVFFNSFGLSIIVFTVIVRAAMIPLSIKQSRQIKAMGAMQPKMKEIQAKFPNDKARQSQETMRMYKEHGVNPLGCLGPMVIQMPIFIGLFWALRATLPSTPESLAGLSNRLYSWLPQVNESVPLDGTFLWLNLGDYASDNPAPLLLPVLVGGSMWLMQKMTTMPSASAQQQSTQRMMLWMMPLMFGYFTLNFETGLALYWIVSNIIGIVIQGFITGWGPFATLLAFRATKGAAADEPSAEGPQAPQQVPSVAAEEVVTDGDDRKDSKIPRRGDRARSKGTRRRARRGRNRRR